MRLCKVLALPTLRNGSDCWTIKDKNKSRIVPTEMTFKTNH